MPYPCRSICVACRNFACRPPYNARRCILGCSVVLSPDPSSCPAFRPTNGLVQHPNQLDLFRRLTAEPHAAAVR